MLVVPGDQIVAVPVAVVIEQEARGEAVAPDEASLSQQYIRLLVEVLMVVYLVSWIMPVQIFSVLERAINKKNLLKTLSYESLRIVNSE